MLSLLAAASIAAPASAAELVPLLEFASPSDYSQNFTVATGWPDLTIAHSSNDDGGIGRGGYMHLPPDIGNTSNLVYDTDGVPGTQTFGDFTIALDSRGGSSVGFLVRGSASRGDSIRLLVTGRNRVRVWLGANVADYQPIGTVAYDETLGALWHDWAHLELDVSNVGSAGDQVGLILRGYNSQARFDESTLVFVHEILLSPEQSAPYLEPGEVGIWMLGAANNTDNFAIYEYGTAPDRRPHPELADFQPAPNALYHDAANGFTFRALAPSGIDPSDITVRLNGLDVSAGLAVGGDPTDRIIVHADLEENTAYTAEIEIVSLTGEITTRTVSFQTNVPLKPVPLVDLIDFASEDALTGNFTVTTGSFLFVDDWDEGIGRGGYVLGGSTSNMIYDPEGAPGTRTFQDFSVVMDHRVGGSITFIVRANRATDQSIRVTLTDRVRLRVWTGSSIATGTAGPLEFDETFLSALPVIDAWAHLQLDVRNAGEEWERHIELRLRGYGSQNDFSAPDFDHTVVLSPAASAAHLDAGEVGIRTGGGQYNIDNFAVYEYGTAPVWSAYPEIRNIFPEPNGFIEGAVPAVMTFEVRSPLGVSSNAISLAVNGADVSDALQFAGDESFWTVTYDQMPKDANVRIEAGAENAVTVAKFMYGDPRVYSTIASSPAVVYDSHGFENPAFFAPGPLAPVGDGGWQWRTGDPQAEIAAVEAPYNQVLRRTAGGSLELDFPMVEGGILIYEADIRVSAADVRTINIDLYETASGARAASFLGWGTIPGQFTHYNGSAWVAVSPLEANRWYHYRVVNYFTGRYANTFDVFIDGELVGEKLVFRHADVMQSPRLRVNASQAAAGQYGEIDNLRIIAHPLVGADYLPLPVIAGLDRDDDGASIQFETYLGYQYLVRYTDDLGSGEWADLDSVAGTGFPVAVDDPGGTGERRFYRVTTIPPTE